MDEQPPTQDNYSLILEAVVGAVLAYFFWQPVYNFFSPIVDSTLGPLLQALGL
jgi:hypothetical protein